MQFKEIKELVELVNKSELTELKIKNGEFELIIKTKHFEKFKPTVSVSTAPASVNMPVPPAGAMPVAAFESKSVWKEPKLENPVEEKPQASVAMVPIISPIVGTFYRASSPDKAAYVKIGDRVNKGDVVCIIEAMKLFNEIESDVSGKVVSVEVEDAQPVEYEQVLFYIDPNG